MLRGTDTVPGRFLLPDIIQLAAAQTVGHTAGRHLVRRIGANH